MLQDTLQRGQQLTDSALDRLLPSETQRPASIHKAMRHSVFAGGKRLRPILCIE
ncbi:MAG: polyprenyl synthetase, partial [Acidobacteria bacterium]